MAAIRAGEQVKVTFEFPDGRIFDVSAYTVSISMYNDMSASMFGDYPLSGYGFFRTKIELEAIEPGTFKEIDRHDYIEKAKTADEWECVYCHLPNPRKAAFCGEHAKGAQGCGAVRPFIYAL